MGESAVFCLGPCVACGVTFAFDPELVPSIRWPQPDGPLEPICRACVDRANITRRANGIDLIVPLRGAYCEEDP